MESYLENCFYIFIIYIYTYHQCNHGGDPLSPDLVRRLPLEDQGRSVGAGLFIIKKTWLKDIYHRTNYLSLNKLFIIKQTIYHRQYDLADNDF